VGSHCAKVEKAVKIVLYTADEKVKVETYSRSIPQKGHTVAIAGKTYEIMQVRWVNGAKTFSQVEILIR